MGTRIRFRTDSRWIAEAKRRGDTFESHFDGAKRSGWYPSKASRARWEETPLPVAGDTWRVHWAHTIGDTGPDIVAGYDICCPKCGEIHGWTTARNCSSLRKRASGVTVCDHSGTGSCWTWTGSAEAGTLSATPSLHAIGACGWHGFLTNGEMTGA